MYAAQLMEQHGCLCTLEGRLQKQRSSLIQNLNVSRPGVQYLMYEQYFPQIQDFERLAEGYGHQIKVFKQLLEAFITDTKGAVNNGVDTVSAVPAVSTVSAEKMSAVAASATVITNGVGRVSAVSAANGVNAVNAANGGYQTTPSPPQQQHQQQQQQQQQRAQRTNAEQQEQRPLSTVSATSPREFAPQTQTEYVQSGEHNGPPPKISDLYPGTRSAVQPPTVPLQSVQSVQSVHSAPRARKPPISSTATMPADPKRTKALITVSTVRSVSPPLPLPLPLPPQRGRPAVTAVNLVQKRQIKVKRRGYKYGGRGFEVWRKNMQRPMYTTTTLRVNKSFRRNERVAKKWMVEKAGFLAVEIEGIFFIDRSERESADRGRGGRGRRGRRGGKGAGGEGVAEKSRFTLFRVRSSLSNIFAKIARLDADPEQESGVMTKQNNRSRTMNQRDRSCKLYVNNFDILDGDCHRKLTSIFLRFGDFEEDIRIERDRQNNPFAIVHYRTLKAAEDCISEHSDEQKMPLFFPTKKEMDRHKKGYLNRKLHIEYNRMETTGSRGRRGRPRTRGRGR